MDLNVIDLSAHFGKTSGTIVGSKFVQKVNQTWDQKWTLRRLADAGPKQASLRWNSAPGAVSGAGASVNPVCKLLIKGMCFCVCLIFPIVQGDGLNHNPLAFFPLPGPL